jgi:hypothetical protein
MKSAPRFTAEERAAIDAWENTPLSREAFEARVKAPWTAREKEDFEALVSWFTRRYPTADARMRAIRHRVAQLRRRDPLPDGDG